MKVVDGGITLYSPDYFYLELDIRSCPITAIQVDPTPIVDTYEMGDGVTLTKLLPTPTITPVECTASAVVDFSLDASLSAFAALNTATYPPTLEILTSDLTHVGVRTGTITATLF